MAKLFSKTASNASSTDSPTTSRSFEAFNSLFGDDRARLRECGSAVREKLTELRLRINPDKYRLLPTRLGVDFVGFVSFSDRRRKVRTANVRAFKVRLRRQLWRARRGRVSFAKVGESVRSWVAHAAHAQSWRLRRDVFSSI